MLMPSINHLRRQVVQRATIRSPLLLVHNKVRPAKISNFDNIIAINQNILQFEITVHDVVSVDLGDSFGYLGYVGGCCGFGELV